MREYFRVGFRGAPVIVRDLAEEDIETLVRYWHESDPAFLESIGVDVGKLAAPEETGSRFRVSIRRDPPGQERVALVFASPDRPLGYTNLHLVDPDHVYAHVHLLHADLRGAGLLSLLFPGLVRAFFEHFPVRRLWFETSTSNRPVNALIQRFGLVPERRHVEHPNGMARPGEMFVYTLTRAALEGIDAAAARLAKSAG